MRQEYARRAFMKGGRMASGGVVLTRADGDDSNFLWDLRCEPSIYEYSRSPEPVEFETHRRWFAHALASESRAVYVATVMGERIGVVRLDTAPGIRVAEVSIALSREHQGAGLGRSALLCALTAARELGFESVTATVHRDNVPSKRLFESIGFKKMKARDEQWLQYEYPAGTEQHS